MFSLACSLLLAAVCGCAGGWGGRAEPEDDPVAIPALPDPAGAFQSALDDSLAIAAGWDTLPAESVDAPELVIETPRGRLTIANLEDRYTEALGALAADSLDQARDLLFVLQDQLLRPLPAAADSLYVCHHRSLVRRLTHLGGLLAEATAFRSRTAAPDSLLSLAYDALAAVAPPDSLRAITGVRRPTLAADLLVRDHPAIDRWIAYFTGPGRRHFADWLRRKAACDSLVASLLVEAGLPRELVYLALIESGLSPHARSEAGAVGPWQFMPGTARRYGLRSDWWVDERRDPELSTRAAVTYLRELYARFKDWALVLSAYNSGENRIERAIRRAGHDDFWRLHLPGQTADFVPKFIAVARIGEDPGRYGFEVPAVESLAYDTVPVDDATDLALIARCAGVPKHEVVALNPALRRQASPPESPDYPVRVPRGRGRETIRALSRVPAEERLTWRRHRVQRGETLSGIAARYGTSAREIATLNKLESLHLIRPGDQLLIPMPAELVAKAERRAEERGHYVPPEGYERVVYRVRAGDTLSSIARRLGVTVNHLRRVNNIHGTSLIRPGQQLFAYRPPAAGAAAGG